jgi:hypothetical protein
MQRLQLIIGVNCFQWLYERGRAELEAIPDMPGKWQKLIELSQNLILSKQTA